MAKQPILQTPRLILREFDYEDTPFIIELVNTPQWLEFIGDRNVHSEADAINYLNNGPLKSYRENGFGLWLVMLKDSGVPIGMCGLLKRETLEDVDIGFAMLPAYANKGYGFEIASATLSYAKYHLKLDKVVAITSPHNIASIGLLTKAGFNFVKTMTSSNGERLLFFSTGDSKNDLEAIDQITASFFNVFTNTKGNEPHVEKLYELFIDRGSIINNSKNKHEVYTVKEFVESRGAILKSGSLLEFSERELSGNTKIFNDLANRFLLYEKSGQLNGESFEAKGVKTIQYVKIDRSWKIVSVVWCDE